MIITKGKKKGIIHTMHIELSHIFAVFFPKDFHEKYRYLGSIPWNEDGTIFKAMEPLIIFMDHRAKPKWCPRWFLRFLHLFGNDNSIVRVRNRWLHNLHRRLTRGILLVDYKTKWSEYDLRISIYGDKQLHDLADMIELKVHDSGLRSELIASIKKLDPEFSTDWWSLDKLSKYKDLLMENEEDEKEAKS